MSLVSLTFGDKNQSFSVPSMMHVFYPKDSIKVDPNVQTKIQVVKTSTFYNSQELYIVGQVISGVIKQNMSCDINGKKIRLEEFDSKLKGVAKEGMTFGFSTLNLSPSEVQKGAVLTFTFEQK